MIVRLRYFARLREAFGTAGEEVSLPAHVRDVGSLAEWLRGRGAPWASELASGRAYRIAVNHDMATAATALSDGAEVAIFPPVTGG